MQHLSLAFFVLLIAAGAARAAAPLLVSGYDDVLRQADNTGLLRAARRMLSADVTYAGMPELYRGLTGDVDAPAFHVVSAMSSAFTPRARRLLERSGYPSARLHFRSWMRQWSQHRFKLAQFEQLLAVQPARRLVVILDNSPTSISLTRTLLHAHRSRIAAVYLRQTVQRDVPAGATPFLTAFDIATSELASGRLEASDAARVATAILEEVDATRVIPEYSYCPDRVPACQQDEPGLMTLCSRVRQRVQAICAARAAD